MAADTATIDELRGIQNPKVERREGSEDRQTVRERFKREQSVESKARKQFDAEGAKMEREAREERFTESEDERRYQRSMAEMRQRIKAATKNRTALRGASKMRMSRFARWGGIGIVCTAYVWQLLFGVISIMTLFAHAYVVEFKENTIVGQIIGFFIDFDEYFPGEIIGYLCWAIVMIISVSVIIGFLFWYRFLGINPFRSALSTFCAFVLFALSILPITNVFPWLVIWVAWMSLSSLFSRR